MIEIAYGKSINSVVFAIVIELVVMYNLLS